jgi:predicted phage terminase large subunit-like protein
MSLSRADAARELIRRRQARTGLLEFTQYTFPGYEVGFPHKIIASAANRLLSDGPDRIDRLMLCAPPRHGKSELISRRLPAFALGHRPDWHVMSASATQTLAEDFGRDVRNIVNSPRYKNLFRTRLAADQQARGRWRTEEGGGYYATGVDGTVIGQGGHLFTIDDLYGTWADAQSETTRKSVWTWYNSTIYNRQEKDARFCLINHRMHEFDLSGQLLEAAKHGGDQWHVINLPAVMEGRALWPEKYPIEALNRFKSAMDMGSPMAWSALYMQDPTPEDGTYFKREWFRRYTERPGNLNVYMSGDFAVSEDKGDFTSLIVWGVDQHGVVYVLDRFSGQVEPDAWTRRMIDLFKLWKPLAFIGEAGLIKSSVEPFLRDAMNRSNVYTVLEWLPTTGHGDKPARCRPFQGLQASGRVYWPHTSWAEEVIAQCLKFPGGRYDDDVDACSLFGRHIADVWSATPPAPEPQPPAWDAPLLITDLYKRKRA